MPIAYDITRDSFYQERLEKGLEKTKVAIKKVWI